MSKEDFKDELKETVLVAVKEAFAAKISEAEQKEDPEDNDEDDDKKVEESEDEDDKDDDDGKKVEESEDEDDEDDKKVEESEDDDEDEDDVVEEALKVKATKGGKVRDLKISNFKALVQLAKNGGYESFVVNDGKEEIEYAVSNGRLVEL